MSEKSNCPVVKNALAWKVKNSVPVTRNAARVTGDVKADCDAIFRTVKDAIKNALGELEELKYYAAHGEYETFSGNAMRWIENKMKVLASNPLAR